MSFLTDIKHWYGAWQLKRSDIEMRRKHQAFNLDTAKRITILFDGTKPEDIKLVKTLVGKLSNGKELVSALGFVDQKDKSFEHMSSLHFDFFSNTDLNWYGKPQGMVIDNFLREDFDILIDLSLKKFYPLTYLAVASPAKFKVGRCREDVNVFDLTIDNSEKFSLERLISEIHHYLNLIKPF
tara:strand:+ start:1733 stop:2278 length:546 start_codon:yes stop_codon:yes gene_type:complete